MMQYDNEELKDKSACAGVRADLKMCLLQSDCCKIVRGLFFWSHFKILYFVLKIQGQEDTSRMPQLTQRAQRVSSSQKHILRMQTFLGEFFLFHISCLLPYSV